MVKRKTRPAWLKIMVGMVLGIVAGLILEEKALYLKPIGTIFLNAIMMMVVPVVFVSLVCGVTAMNDMQQMGRVATKTGILYVISMCACTSIGLFTALSLDLGKGTVVSSLSGFADGAQKAVGDTSFTSILVNIVPGNVTLAFSEGNVLQIIFFALLFGVSINLVGEKGSMVASFFESLQAIVFQFVRIVMSFAPIGVFALMAVVAGTQGTPMLLALFWMVFVIYISLIFVNTVGYGLALTVSRISPFPFVRKMLEVQAVAFSTASSAATLPVNLRVAEENLGISRPIVSFCLPLGATVNMNGLATYLGIITVFGANLYGVELSFADLAMVVGTSCISAIGCAGVPAAGLIVMPIVLSSVGIPLEFVGLMTAVNRVIDMMSTVTNITGDVACALIVAKHEGELDEAIYMSSEKRSSASTEAAIS